MEKFVVSARKYRPITFNTVVGQPNITNTLKNAIRNNHLAQAFLFTGPRGVGKTTTARILAKTINCLNVTPEVEACNTCEMCMAFNEGQSLNIYELDAASNNSVDDIRALVDQVRYAPQMGKYKVYIIDEVHMLSVQAFNAFLKTLEEPPSYAIFILATTEKHKIIPTILSRCQIFDFSRISIENIVSHLQHVAKSEGVTAEIDALHIIAQKAEGALRDSLSIFDQLISFAGNNLTYKDVIQNLNILDYDYYFRITDDLLAAKIPEVLMAFNEILNHGFDAHNFITGLASHFRDLLVCKDEITLSLLEVSPSVKEKYRVQATTCNANWLLFQLDLASKADYQYRSAKNQRLHIELTLMKMCTSNQIISAPAEGAKKKIELAINSVVASPAVSQPVTTPVAAPIILKEKETVAISATPAKPAVAEIQKQENPVTTAPRPSVPTYKKSISIKENLNGSAEKKSDLKSEEVLPDLSAPFDQPMLEGLWRIYSEKLEKQGRMTLSAAMKKRTPILGKNYELNFIVDSAAAEKDMNEEKLELLIYLRKELSNYKISLVITVNVNETSDGPAYTPSEKFKRLAEINPAMNELKKSFDLEIEY
ncbi:MAG: DNA polymerase III subunit gamma/tau [Bacteroidota bacterium]